MVLWRKRKTIFFLLGVRYKGNGTSSKSLKHSNIFEILSKNKKGNEYKRQLKKRYKLLLSMERGLFIGLIFLERGRYKKDILSLLYETVSNLFPYITLWIIMRIKKILLINEQAISVLPPKLIPDDWNPSLYLYL